MVTEASQDQLPTQQPQEGSESAPISTSSTTVAMDIPPPQGCVAESAPEQLPVTTPPQDVVSSIAPQQTVTIEPVEPMVSNLLSNDHAKWLWYKDGLLIDALMTVCL